jgi:pyruvate dehydrogenase E2 component (dihydrolipoamide acetyltransferase)
MATDVIMPSLGFDMAQGTLSQWLKKEGDRVEKGEPIAEIETEKATVEVEAVAPGILRNIAVQPGATVPVGTVMAVLAAPDEVIAAQKKPRQTADAKTAEQSAGEKHPAVASERQAAPAQAAPAETVPAETRLKASPVARRMAEGAGVDLSQIKGTGPDGRIVERDVEEAIARSKPAADIAQAPAPAVKASETTPPPAETQVTLNRMRQAIARRMAESKATIPHFYVTMDIDMTEAMKMREQLNNLAPDEEKVTVNDLIVAAAARALTRFPMLNSSYKDDHLDLHKDINVGIAVPVEDGLVVPVLGQADKKTLKAIAVEAKGLAERARSNKMKAEDLGPATFTVSNLGGFGVDQFVAIINPPEAAILAVGSAARRAIVDGDVVRPALMMKATISVDHRVADGVLAARYLQELKKLLENPVNLLL